MEYINFHFDMIIEFYAPFLGERLQKFSFCFDNSILYTVSWKRGIEIFNSQW